MKTLLLICAMALASPPITGKTDEDRASSFIRLLRKRDFKAATRTFDPTMKNAMSAAQLQQAWDGVVSQAGSYTRADEYRKMKQGQLTIVDVMSTFTRAPLAVRVVFDAKGRVAGLFFLPPNQALPASLKVDRGAKRPRSPKYVKAGAFTETDVTVGSKPWQLPGTLAVPNGSGPHPVVLLIAGSGPNDRDETIGPNKPFRDLAHGLATSGVASLRYDKRTHVYGGQMNAKTVTVEEEVLADALHALGFLRKQKKIDPKRIYVLGHSLGGTLAPVIAQRDKQLAGVIVMAGSARPLHAVMIEQLDYIGSLPTHQGRDEQAKIAEMKAQLRLFQKGKLADDELVFGASARYLKDLQSRRSVEVAAKLKAPILVMQGGRDYQVTVDDYKIWKAKLAKRKGATFKMYPKLNHLFGEGSGMATPEEYMEKRFVAEAVVTDIRAFVNDKR